MAFLLTPASAARATPVGANQLWVGRYNGIGTWLDQANAMAVSPDGSRVFVTGKSSNNGGGTKGFDAVTVAFDAATGATVWASRYDDSHHGYDEGSAIAVSPDGSRVFVAGLANGSTGTTGANYLTLAIDAATGGRLWARRYDGPAHDNDEALAVAVSPDGSKVFTTGQSRGGTIQPDWATIAYDASTGHHLWLKRLGSIDRWGSANAVAVSPDGTEVFVTGEQTPVANGSWDFVMAAYDAATGSRVWFAAWDGSGNNDNPVAIAVSPDGSKVFATGSTVVVPYTDDYATVAWDAKTGAQLWVQLYEGPAGLSGFDDATAIAASADGSRVFVTGASDAVDGYPDEDYATLAYDANTGSQLWLERFDDGHLQGDLAESIAVTPDGSQVFVTGLSYFSSRSWNDYVTVAYAAGDGAALGVSTYDGRLHQEDIAVGVAVSPDGSKAFVTGYSQELYGSSYDYVTVAYAVH